MGKSMVSCRFSLNSKWIKVDMFHHSHVGSIRFYHITAQPKGGCNPSCKCDFCLRFQGNFGVIWKLCVDITWIVHGYYTILHDIIIDIFTNIFIGRILMCIYIYVYIYIYIYIYTYHHS